MNTTSASRTAAGSAVVNVRRFSAHIPAQQLLEARLVDRHLAGPEGTDLRGVLVHAHDVVAALGKAHTRHEPHIPGPNHRKSHTTPVATPTKNANAIIASEAPPVAIECSASLAQCLFAPLNHPTVVRTWVGPRFRGAGNLTLE